MSFSVQAVPHFSLFTREQCEAVHFASLEILRRTGVRVEMAFGADARENYVRSFDAFSRSIQEIAGRKGLAKDVGGFLPGGSSGCLLPRHKPGLPPQGAPQ